MSAVSLTINALKAGTNTSARVSTRVHPFPLPHSTALPALAVAMSAEADEYHLQGASQYPEASVQIHCVAATAREAIELGEAVKVDLRDLLYIDGVNSPPLARASFRKESTDFTDYADNLSTHRRVMTFSVRWR